MGNISICSSFLDNSDVNWTLTGHVALEVKIVEKSLAVEV